VPNLQWKNPDDGQRNCPTYVEFLDKNKFVKLMGLLVLLKRNSSTCKVGFLSQFPHYAQYTHYTNASVIFYFVWIYNLKSRQTLGPHRPCGLGLWGHKHKGY
jgi:hypothetical protein